MQWLAFATLPLLFAALIYAAAEGKLQRALVVAVAASSVVLECVLLASAISTWAWPSVLSACVLVVALPWVAALIFAWYVPLRRKARAWSAAAPLVYCVVFLLGAALGDVTGWIPQ